MLFTFTLVSLVKAITKSAENGTMTANLQKSPYPFLPIQTGRHIPVDPAA